MKKENIDKNVLAHMNQNHKYHTVYALKYRRKFLWGQENGIIYIFLGFIIFKKIYV